jgi:hypothetical protein
MRTTVLFFCLAISTFCSAQAPDFCNLLRVALNDTTFMRLIQMDTTSKQQVAIIDANRTFQKCDNIKFSNNHNSFRIITYNPVDSTFNFKKRYYNCVGIVNDNDNPTQYKMLIQNYEGRFVAVYYALKNGQWRIDHFKSGSTNPMGEDD